MISISCLVISGEETTLKNPPIRLLSILNERYEKDEFDTGELMQELQIVPPVVLEIEFDYKLNEIFVIEPDMIEIDEAYVARRKIVASELVCDSKISFPFESQQDQELVVKVLFRMIRFLSKRTNVDLELRKPLRKVSYI